MVEYKFKGVNERHKLYLNEFGEGERYGSNEMRGTWSPYNKQLKMRKCWVALARAQGELVPRKAVSSMSKNLKKIDIDRIDEIEKRTKHDVVAAKEHFEEVAPEAKGYVHYAATSMDIQDNAEVLMQKESLKIIKTRLVNLLDVFRQKILEHKDTVINAYTHGQVAEPTTLGYRYANYAQSLLESLSEIDRLEKGLKGKGLKGAVGTSASYAGLLGSEAKAEEMERQVLKELGLKTFEVTTQTYPRTQDLDVTSALNKIGGILAKINYDYLLVGSTPFNEYREGFAPGQKGSSAMPHKKNQTKVENIIGLSHVITGFHHMIEGSVKFGALERTIHDSVVRRIAIPQIFLATDEALSRSIHVLKNTDVNNAIIDKNLREYGVFGLSEPVLSEMSKKMDRSEAYTLIQEHAKAASSVIANGGSNDFISRIIRDERIIRVVPREKLEKILSIEQLKHHVGNAPRKAESMANEISRTLKPYKKLIGKTHEIKI
ncbi:MAG: adenylosuccinate lyase [Candidatus Micrarchaeota archaeon]